MAYTIYSKVGADDAITDAVAAVTAASLGAATTAALTAHASATNNPHSVTAAQTGAATAGDLAAHTGNTSNPHSVTKAQVGLANADNTSDAAKPVSTATQAALDLKANAATLTVVTDATTARTLALSDAGKHIDFTSASPITVTVPANATAAFPVGSIVGLARYGAGTLTVAGAGGVTVNSAGGLLSVAEQYGAAALRKTATDTWHLIGALG